MRLAALFSLFLLVASPALADSDVPMIRLGEAPPAPPGADPAAVKAVERFLTLRQDASESVIKTAALRRQIAGTRNLDDELLAGPRGSILLAFDFQDADLPAKGRHPGRFDLPVTVLFSKKDGPMVESRTERITFVAAAGGYACANIVPIDVVAWDAAAAVDEADEAGIGGGLDVLRAHLRSASRHDRWVGYSLADVEREDDGRFVVRAIRYLADPGRRGFEVDEEPVVLVKRDGSFRIESN
ncbi:MAG TPA: hypothetical protein VF363_06060 [Candidatus Eisenbacteria bacterium]